MTDLVIPLTRGFVARVSPEDYDRVVSFRWHVLNDAYAVRMTSGRQSGGRFIVPRKTILMHQFIIGDVPDGLLVDHRNGDGLDNRRENLRIATYSTNGQNGPNGFRGTSRFRGVCWAAREQKWRAEIAPPNSGRHSLYLGRFASEEEAARAYDVAAVRLYGPEAYVNFR